MSKTPKNNLRKNFIWNLIGTTLSSFSSLFFMIIVTRINGINDAGIFTFAFSTACVFYVIGIYSGRTFQITDKDKTFSDSDYFYSKLLTCFIMLLVSIVFCLCRSYDFIKFFIIISLSLFKILEAFSESTYAVIQKQDRLHQVGKSLFAKAFLSLLAFLIADLLTQDLILSSSLIFFANLAIILIYDFPRLCQANFKLKKCNPKKVWQLICRGFFAFGFAFLNLCVIQAAKYAIDFTAGNDIQTYYGIIAMPATVLSLFGQYVIQPFLTSLKKALTTNLRAFTKLTIKLCGFVLAFGAFCLLAAWALGIPVLELLYAVELPDCLVPLLLIILGGIFNALVLVLSTSLTTMRYTGGQFVVYIITAIFALLVSPLLVANFGLFGASLSYLLAMLGLLILYIILTIYYIKKEAYAKTKN